MKTLFIDRDGVINKDPGGWTEHSYVTREEDLHFLPGSLEALRKLKENGFQVIIVSNQAGVNKGYFTEKTLRKINERMIRSIEGSGGKIKAVYYCIHKGEERCDCRKPKPGLITKAAREHKIDLKSCFIIGDGVMDIEAGRQSGLTTILVLSGKSSREDVKKWDIKPDHIFTTLLEAVDWVIGHYRQDKGGVRR